MLIEHFSRLSEELCASACERAQYREKLQSVSCDYGSDDDVEEKRVKLLQEAFLSCGDSFHRVKLFNLTFGA